MGCIVLTVPIIGGNVRLPVPQPEYVAIAAVLAPVSAAFVMPMFVRDWGIIWFSDALEDAKSPRIIKRLIAPERPVILGLAIMKKTHLRLFLQVLVIVELAPRLS